MPSKDTRFRKGMSGNRKGRPKGRPKVSKNFASDFMSEANETVAVNVSGRRRYMSIARAGIKQLMSKAAAGDLPAIKQVLDRMESLEVRAAQYKSAHDFATFSDKDREVIGHVHSMLKTQAGAAQEAADGVEGDRDKIEHDDDQQGLVARDPEESDPAASEKGPAK